MFESEMPGAATPEHQADDFDLATYLPAYYKNLTIDGGRL